MFGDDMATAFVTGLVLAWAGLLVVFRRAILGRDKDEPGVEFLHPNEDERRQQAPVTPGWAELNGWTYLGMALSIVGYVIMCCVAVFWMPVVGVLMIVVGFIALPVVVVWRAR